MGEHEHLAAMMGFVSDHVAEHLGADGPRLSPAVAVKFLDAAFVAAKGFGEHLGAAKGALGECCAGLFGSAVGSVELGWDLQVRGCEAYPLAADVVRVGEDGCDGAGVAGRFGFPCGGVEMFDDELVHAIVGREDLDCCAAKLSVSFGLALGHGCRSLSYSTSDPPLSGLRVGAMMQRAKDQSFRPLGFTPAFGRAEAPFGVHFTARVNACPSRKQDRFGREFE
jgi:hypothetical protein